MNFTRYISVAAIMMAATLFATNANAQNVAPVANGQYVLPMANGQQVQAPVATGQTMNISDSVTNSGLGCGGCSTGCDSGCGQGCGQRPRMLNRLRNALPSIQMSGGNDCGCTYRSIFGGWTDLDDLNTAVAGAPATNGHVSTTGSCWERLLVVI